MATILEVARFNQLMGNDLGEQQYQGAIQIWKTFMSAFQTTCYQQSFDRDIVFGLERQNQLLGGTFDIIPCADRLFTAEFAGRPAGTMRFTHCGLGVGDWKIVVHDGLLHGSGTGQVDRDGLGTWSAFCDNRR